MQTQRTVILMEIHRARTKTPIRTAAIHVQMFPTAETAEEI